MKNDEERPESIKNVVKADDTSKMETLPSRHPGSKLQPKDIMQSPHNNFSRSPITRGLPNLRQLNITYTADQSKDRLERHTRSRTKKAEDEMLDDCVSDSDRLEKYAVLAEDTKLMHTNSEEGGSGDDICSPSRSHSTITNTEDEHSVRRAAVNTMTYMDDSGGSESEEESDFAAAINSKQCLQLTRSKGEEQEGESKGDENVEDNDEDSKEDERVEDGDKKKTTESGRSIGDEGDEQSYIVSIGEDTSRSSVSFHADILTDDEEQIETNVKSPEKRKPQ